MNQAVTIPDSQIMHGEQPALVPLASPSCREVCTALAVAQGEFEVPKRTKEATVRGQTKSGGAYDYKYKYAPLEEIIAAVKNALAKNGLFRQQYLVSNGGIPVIRTIIWHTSGEWIASDYPIHQSKDGAQGFAAGVTYARRYGLSLALGLAPEDDDDATENAKIEDAPRRPPQRQPIAAANVMQPESQHPSGAPSRQETPSMDEIMAMDDQLSQASINGITALQEVWMTLPN